MRGQKMLRSILIRADGVVLVAKCFLTNTTPAFGHPSSAEEGSFRVPTTMSRCV
jgi:hypothetical protein